MLLPAADWLIWQDEYYLAINKPAGLLSLPDGYDPAALHVRQVLAPIVGHVWIIHRLDRQTSGVMLLAKSASAHRAANHLFETRQIDKRYHAVLVGNPPWEQCTADTPLRSGAGRRKRSMPDPERGKPAHTEFSVLGRAAAQCLVEANPKTGRTHQIRAHACLKGFPLLGDALYGSGTLTDLISRPALHACRLTFTHPFTQQTIHISADYPPDFAQLLARLGWLASTIST